MAAEIAEQPTALTRTLEALLPQRQELRHLARRRRHVLFAARGTSDNAAVYGRYLVETHAGLGATLGAPSLATHYEVDRDLTDTLHVAVSQSGATDEIVRTQRWAATRGAATVAITNEPDSPLAREADLALITAAGREVAVPATKSHTAQLMAIATIADALGQAVGDLEAELWAVPDAVGVVLDERRGVDDAVATLATVDRTLVSGRGLAFATALELALKLEETCLEPVRGLSYADLRHGPIAVVDHDVAAVLVAAADGPMLPGMLELARDLDDLGATTVAIGGDAAFQAASRVIVAGPDLPERVAPIGLVVPGQLVVEALARALGLDPDAPRGLSKVTQTDPADGPAAT
jgi:glutamine---fructose-6-phosphate transaminase (isomerizing)